MITIDELVPLLKPGFVAMDADGDWCWYAAEPTYSHGCCWWCKRPCLVLSISFDIKKFDGDWKDSLIEIKGDKK